MNDYLIYSDGGSRGNPGPAAAAFLVFNINGKRVYHCGKFLGIATNNVAEYQAVLMAISWLLKNISQKERAKYSFYLDSELVVNQLSGRYQIKDEKLKKIAAEIKKMESEFNGKVTFNYLPREFNRMADYLVNQKMPE